MVDKIDSLVRRVKNSLDDSIIIMDTSAVYPNSASLSCGGKSGRPDKFGMLSEHKDGILKNGAYFLYLLNYRIEEEKDFFIPRRVKGELDDLLERYQDSSHPNLKLYSEELNTFLSKMDNNIVERKLLGPKDTFYLGRGIEDKLLYERIIEAVRKFDFTETDKQVLHTAFYIGLTTLKPTRIWTRDGNHIGQKTHELNSLFSIIYSKISSFSDIKAGYFTHQGFVELLSREQS